MNKKLSYILLIPFLLIVTLYAQEEFEESADINIYDQYEKPEEENGNTGIYDQYESQGEDNINTNLDDRYERSEKESAAYIESFGNKFSLRLSAYMSDLSFINTYDRGDAGRFHFGKGNNNGDTGYRANRPLEIGLGFVYGSLGFEIRSQTSLFYDSDYQKTETLEWQLSYYTKSMAFELQIKDYKGFHTDSGEETDLHLHCAGIFYQYAWNSEEYSWRAAFGLYEKQLRSAGSFLLGGNVFYIFDDLPEVYKRKYILAAPNIGYAYTWVYKSNLFFALSGSGGLGMAYELSDSKNHPAFTLSLYGAAGYHWKDLSFVLSYKTIAFSIPLGHNKTDSFATTMGQCSVVKRF